MDGVWFVRQAVIEDTSVKVGRDQVAEGHGGHSKIF